MYIYVESQSMMYSWYSRLVNLHINVCLLMVDHTQNKGPAQDWNGVRIMLYGKSHTCDKHWISVHHCSNLFPIWFSTLIPKLQTFTWKLSLGFSRPSYIEWCPKWRTNRDDRIVNSHLWLKLFVNMAFDKSGMQNDVQQQISKETMIRVATCNLQMWPQWWRECMLINKH